jgi:hypothetical protein
MSDYVMEPFKDDSVITHAILEMITLIARNRDESRVLIETSAVHFYILRIFKGGVRAAQDQEVIKLASLALSAIS